MKIFVIAGFGIGDILATTPLIRNLKKKISGVEIYLLNEKVGSKNREGRQLLADCKYLTGYIENERLLQEKGTGIIQKIKANAFKLRELYRLIRTIRKYKFDIIIDSWPSTKNTAILSFLSGAKKRMGYLHNPFSFLYTDTINAMDLPKPLADAQFITSLGGKIKETDCSLELFIDYQKTKSKITPLLSKEGISKKKLVIGFNVGRDKDIGRQWTTNNWITVGKYLEKKYNAIILFLGDNVSIQSAKDVEKKLQKKHCNLVGKLSFEESLFALSQCDLLVSINNGLMHMAAAEHIPIVAMSGFSLPGWDVFEKNTLTLRKHDVLNCWKKAQKCKNENYKCADECMKLISPKEVITAADTLLLQIMKKT